MPEWTIAKLEIPEPIPTNLEGAADFIDGVVAYLDVVATAVEAAAIVALAALDTYATLVNLLIDTLQDFLNDLRFAGVYVLVDYPQSITGLVDGIFTADDEEVRDFFKEQGLTEEVILAGTVIDPDFTSNRRDLLNYDDFLAVASKRKAYRPITRDFISYDQAIGRAVNAFFDITDPLRPQFSDTAQVAGVTIMVYNESVPVFLRLVEALEQLFALSDLAAIRWPAFSQWLPDLGDSMADALDSYDPEDWQLPIESRNSGVHPNWVARTTVQELIPPVGEALRVGIELLETLRPTGELAQLIEDILNAILRKIERLQAILELISELLRLLAEGPELSFVVVQSTEGPRGFVNELRASTGHPEFTQALVCTLTLFAGGPSAEPLVSLFSAPGKKIADTQEESIERRNSGRNNPLV